MARYLPADHVGVLVGVGRPVKRGREIVEILEAYDLTGSYRAVAELAGCDHHTVARYVKFRAAGQAPHERTHRASPTVTEYALNPDPEAVIPQPAEDADASTQ